MPKNTHLLRSLKEHQRRGVGPAGDGRHEGRVPARVLRRQQRLEVRPEDGAVADALEGGEGRRAAVVLALCRGCGRGSGGSRVLLCLGTEINVRLGLRKRKKTLNAQNKIGHITDMIQGKEKYLPRNLFTQKTWRLQRERSMQWRARAESPHLQSALPTVLAAMRVTGVTWELNE